MMRERFSWSRWVGIIVKEFIQLKRDRLTFGMIIGIPVLQLILFGYAINADPKRLPTAVLSADSSPYSRTLLAAMQTSGYFRIDRQAADEAERCHRLAYIAWGDLLATGTPDEVLHRSPLFTWEVSGPAARLAEISSLLKERSGVAHVTAFGHTLHVTGEEAGALERAVTPFLREENLQWRKAEPTLEDVFIHLMAGAAESNSK